MVADTPEQAVDRVDRAFNQGDLEAVLGFYEPAAVVVTAPGQLARGHEELRRFFAGVLRSGASAHQLTTRVLEADGVALFLSRWIFTPAADLGANPQTFIATTVLRRQPDGTWKALIDNSFGPLILGPA